MEKVLNFADFIGKTEFLDKPVAFICEGEDAFFKENALKFICNKFLQEKNLNYAQFNNENFDEQSVLSSLRSLPFLSEKRVTVIYEFYPKLEFINKINSCVKGQNKSILIISNVKKFDALKKIDNCLCINCDKAESGIITKWIKNKFNKDSVKISDSLAMKLAEYCLFDMKRIENESEKLICYAGKGNEISLEDIESLVSKDFEYKIYELTEKIGKKNFDKAFSILTDLISKGETSQGVVGYMYNYMRRLLHISISNKTDNELSSLLNIKEYAVKKSREQAKLFKAVNLKKAVDYLSESDYKIKSGKALADDEMWKDLFKILTLSQE